MPGRDVRAIYLEHNAPQGRIAEMRHPAADRDDLTVVHVTHFNALFWDCGTTPVRVIEHGVVDPGYRYTGELPRAAVAINEARAPRARDRHRPARALRARCCRSTSSAWTPARLGGFDDPPQARAARRDAAAARLPASDALDVAGPRR